MDNKINIKKYKNFVKNIEPITHIGVVKGIVGQIVESEGPHSQIGDICEIINSDNGDRLRCEVIGFNKDKTLLMPYSNINNISPGSKIIKLQTGRKVPISDQYVGRIINALGHPIDKKGPINATEYYDINSEPPDPLDRLLIKKPINTGIRAIDGLLTLGEGQRVGLFAGSGVGKSTLLGMIAKNSEADINVIGLIGERGREVREFIENDLGEKGLEKSVVVVATSDNQSILRIKAALLATTIAEFFRDRGKKVMLMIDSLTRYAMAIREMGLSTGELPVARGYTPSMYPLLAKLLERAGNSDKASITAIYSVLVEGDEMNEPVADTVRGILDGHIILSRELASSNHYPAIDVLESISRVMPNIVNNKHMEVAGKIKSLLAKYNEIEDLINIGAYKKGNNPVNDEAIDKIDSINNFLRQGIEENYNASIYNKMIDIFR